MIFRRKLKKSDIAAVSEILNSTGYFYGHEIKIALELAKENLNKGEENSGYIFIVVETDEKPVAFACYGKTPCTANSFDLYWIAVHKDCSGKGIGKALIKMIEENIRCSGGKNIWAETSSRPLYEPTRQFYIRTGYEKIAELPGFYDENDNKIIFLKKV